MQELREMLRTDLLRRRRERPVEREEPVQYQRIVRPRPNIPDSPERSSPIRSSSPNSVVQIEDMDKALDRIRGRSRSFGGRRRLQGYAVCDEYNRPKPFLTLYPIGSHLAQSREKDAQNNSELFTLRTHNNDAIYFERSR